MTSYFTRQLEVPVISEDAARTLAQIALTEAGVPVGDATDVADALVDTSLDHNDGDDEGLLNRHQTALRDALRDRSAMTWSSVPPIHPETRNLLSSFWVEARENAPLWKKTRDLGLLLDSVFASKSWRLGFAITRLWRRIRPSDRAPQTRSAHA